MKLDANDPRVTAFVLGEFEDEAARQEIEAAIASCPESRALVEELRALTNALTNELMASESTAAQSETAPALDDERRAALEARLASEETAEQAAMQDTEQADAKVVPLASRKRRRHAWLFGGSLAAAASLLVVLGVGSMMLLGRKDAPMRNVRVEIQAGRPQVQFATTPRGATVLDVEKGRRTTHTRSRTLRNFAKSGEGDTDRDESRVADNKPKLLARLGKKGEKRDELDDLWEKPSEDKTKTINGLVTTPDVTGKDGDGQKGKLKDRGVSGETYVKLPENPFHRVSRAPLSTFSIDVDTASYSNMRRFLTQEQLPPPASVRIEELINYFSYDYAPPQANDKTPFAVHVDVSQAPWNPTHQLLRIGLKGRVIQRDKRPPSNLVFLIDVSGSMSEQNKLPLLRRGLSMLVRRLGENDRVAIAVYAGASGLVLPSTPCTDKNRPRILSALERLQSGGSTNGGAGIKLAYDVAIQSAIAGGTNRVILATDGDFNVGTTNRQALLALIKQKAKSKVFLTVLGFGMGNLKDATLEQLANKGNGNYAYIDTLAEAQKVLVQQLSGTLVTIAKDVKIQVEMNPAKIAAYRLIGYENRMLATKDFADDKKDAGEIGAGHTVTALYELVPVGTTLPNVAEPALRYQKPTTPTAAARRELLTVKLRYKQPEGDKSTLVTLPVSAQAKSLERSSADFRLAAAVAWFGMVLRGSSHLPAAARTLGPVLKLAKQGVGRDRFGYRQELVSLIARANNLRANQR